ncbi:hypothetical protein F4679DRAFT_563800 [Xylaria curta]|nr:hypothetical protein F4679DRAFT_563800 [Xylaria curta]
MGGYILHEGDDKISRNPPRHCHCCSSHLDVRDNKVSHEGRLSELRVWESADPDKLYKLSLSFAINARQLRDLMDRGLIADLPRLSQEDIEDRSKGDIFIKLWTLFQVLWLIVELIVRKVSGLSSS